MVENADLLAAVLAAPDDDGPRLVYADWLEERGDARGELIQLQCAAVRTAAMEERASALLAAHRATWLGALAPARAVFVRGFVERVAIAPLLFVSHGRTLLAREPVRHLVIEPTNQASVPDWPRSLFEALVDSRLHELDLASAMLGDDGVARLAHTPALASLRRLVLAHCNLDDAQLDVLIASPWLPRGMTLALDDEQRVAAEQGDEFHRGETNYLLWQGAAPAKLTRRFTVEVLGVPDYWP